MTKQASASLRVGVVFVVAALLSALGAFSVWHVLSAQIHIAAIFDTASGVSVGDPVYMSGVNIGKVDSISLTPDTKAKLALSINKGTHVPVESAFLIKPSPLQNVAVFSIVPAKNPPYLSDGAVVVGQVQDPLAGLLSQSGKIMETANQTLADTQKLVRSATKTLGVLTDKKRLAQIDDTLDNIRLSTARLPLIEEQAGRDLEMLTRQTNQLLAGASVTRANADRAINGAGQLTASLNTTVNENRSNIRALLRSANDAASSVAGLVDELKSTLTDKDMRKNLVATTANLQSVSARLDSTASDIQRLADDPRVNSDVRETVTNLRATSESVRNLAERFEGIHIPGERRRSTDTGVPPPSPPPYSSTSLLEPGLVFDSLYDTKMERFRFDGDYSLLTGHSGAFYRLGLYDATYGNRANIEAGQGLFGNRFDYRYGIIAGKLGLGFDVRTGPIDLRLDAYDPNRGTVNARAKLNLNRSSAITAGVESIGAGNRATVGLQIRR